MAISVYPAASSGVTGKKQQVFTSSGTFTAPTASTYNNYVEVLCVGGGSSNYYAASWGGAVVSRVIQANAGVGYTVTIGAGGASGSNPGNNSSFAGVTTVTANGGDGTAYEGAGASGGGTSGYGTAAGLPGTYGFGGGGGGVAGNDGMIAGGTDGGGMGSSTTGLSAAANTGGSGGRGGTTTGAGGSGICIVTWWQ